MVTNMCMSQASGSSILSYASQISEPSASRPTTATDSITVSALWGSLPDLSKILMIQGYYNCALTSTQVSNAMSSAYAESANMRYMLAVSAAYDESSGFQWLSTSITNNKIEWGNGVYTGIRVAQSGKSLILTSVDPSTFKWYHTTGSNYWVFLVRTLAE